MAHRFKPVTAKWKAGDLAQWLYPWCVVRILDVDVSPGVVSYSIEAIPGINGTPLDVNAGDRFSVSQSSLTQIPAGVILPAQSSSTAPPASGSANPKEVQA